jgi:hypothetical protein
MFTKQQILDLFMEIIVYGTVDGQIKLGQK